MSTPASFLPPNPNNPLNATHLQQINNALQALAQAEAMANQANAAGIDQTTNLANIQSQRAQLLKIKNVYFPGL